MAANTNPQYGNKANVNTGVAVTAANTKSDGSGTIGTDLFVVLTAGANDTYVNSVDWWPTASAANTAVATTIARLFISSQVSPNATSSANTELIDEVSLPAATGANSSAANNPVSRPLNRRVPAGYTLLASNHAAPNANTAWKAVPDSLDY